MAELVYAVDLKSAGLTALRVRVPPRPPTKMTMREYGHFSCAERFELQGGSAVVSNEYGVTDSLVMFLFSFLL